MVHIQIVLRFKTELCIWNLLEAATNHPEISTTVNLHCNSSYVYKKFVISVRLNFKQVIWEHESNKLMSQNTD